MVNEPSASEVILYLEIHMTDLDIHDLSRGLVRGGGRNTLYRLFRVLDILTSEYSPVATHGNLNLPETSEIT